MELKEIEQFNDWWTSGTVRSNLLMPYKRPLYHEILNYLADRQILLLYGIRRVGKTSLCYQLIQYLLDEGVEPGNILYFSFDVAKAGIGDLLRTIEERKDCTVVPVWAFVLFKHEFLGYDKDKSV
jgi:predicted AAA+ superfamily ATPase